ncbi:hypothetical protein GCM10008090_22270 [Arenicella chitinivorans]|uniref:Cytochrome c domain-containing protein n=1 Tax=Arenicella chitinivorans TaxID=1329800 RepID=A0A918VNS6_9GAMM|nr:cytochrome c peroxidase [Arenicella chitinivorans]GHA11992.1 hypothetical protein GCM10008090_22270 [Arenicella chitinivorans]
MRKSIKFSLAFLICFLGGQHAYAQTFLESNKQVCIFLNTEQKCPIIVNWNYDGNDEACVYLEGQSVPLTCEKGVRFTFSDTPVNGVVKLELRVGASNNYPTTVQSLTLIGLENGASPEVGAAERVKLDYVKKHGLGTGVSTASWDGKLFFYGQGNITCDQGQKKAFMVRVFRHKRLAIDQGKVDFQDPDLFSARHKVACPEDLHVENVGTKMSVYPHPSLKKNPYKSNASGSADPNGTHMTYLFYAIMSTPRYGVNDEDGSQDESQHYLNANTNQKKTILGKFRGQVIVQDPDTEHASIASATHLSPAAALKIQSRANTSDPYIYGYEHSVSLDGSLIVYSGNPYPAVRPGYGGMISYVYSKNQFIDDTWSVPENLADMYTAHGAGSANESLFSGNQRFSERFPIAAQPIEDYAGNVAPTLFGAYPWVSFDASEVVFSSVPNFFGARRQGTLMVGERTGWILTHVDGDTNLVRGNPLVSGYPPKPRFNTAPKSDEDIALDIATREAYRELTIPSLGGTETIQSAYQQVLLAPVGLFGSSWSPFAEEVNSVLPLNRNKNSYGFFVTGGNKYVEMPLIDNFDDLLIYYPMNEPIGFNETDIDYFVEGLELGQLRRSVNTRHFNEYVVSETADYSKFHHTGTFTGFVDPLQSAQETPIGYPFEINDVVDTWAATWETTKELKDGQDGYFGNAVTMKKGSRVETTLKPQARQQLLDAQEFTIAYWLSRGGALLPTQEPDSPITGISGLFLHWMYGDTLTFRLFTSDHPFSSLGSAHSHSVVMTEPWNHFAFTYKAQVLSLYLNGELVKSVNISGSLAEPNSMIATFGPGGSDSVTITQLQMDEVYLYSRALEADEVERLAGIKRVPTTNSGIQTASQFSDLAQEFTSLPSGEDQAIRDLGEALFNSPLLSANLSMSCASCHKPAEGFGDGDVDNDGIDDAVSQPFPGGQLSRNTPPLMNLLFGNHFFFDGRAASLEEQVLHPILSENELGNHLDPSAVLARIMTPPANQNGPAFEEFNPEFLSIFGRDVNYTDLSLVLARYIRGIQTQTPVLPLTAEQQRGKEVFFGHANCVACHAGPNFSDNQFHDIGLTDTDSGLGGVSKQPSDVGKFKTPSLWNVELTAPYFHNGSAQTLDDVVQHYNLGLRGANTSAFIRPLKLNAQQRSDLVAYLRSLQTPIDAH